MKKIIVLLFAWMTLCLVLAGCNTVTQTIYLQNVEVNGPVNQPPLHVTNDQKKGDVTLTADFNFNTNKQVSGRIERHSPVNKFGFYQIDTISSTDSWRYSQATGNVYNYDGKNLEWNIPELSVNINADFCVSNHLALALGLNYSVQNQRDLLGGNAGLGIYSQQGNGAFRIDVGVLWQTMAYSASTVVITLDTPYRGSTDTTISFFQDNSTSRNFNPYIMFTYNSTFKESQVNFFFNLAYFSQTILDFEPSSPNPEFYPFGTTLIRSDQRGEATAVFVSGAAGVYIDLNDITRLSIGARVFHETQIEEASKSLYVMPVFQIDMRL